MRMTILPLRYARTAAHSASLEGIHANLSGHLPQNLVNLIKVQEIRNLFLRFRSGNDEA
jgi:hypothetical protein